MLTEFILADGVVNVTYLFMHFRVHWDPKCLGVYAEGCASLPVILKTRSPVLLSLQSAT